MVFFQWLTPPCVPPPCRSYQGVRGNRIPSLGCRSRPLLHLAHRCLLPEYASFPFLLLTADAGDLVLTPISLTGDYYLGDAQNAYDRKDVAGNLVVEEQDADKRERSTGWTRHLRFWQL